MKIPVYCCTVGSVARHLDKYHLGPHAGQLSYARNFLPKYLLYVSTYLCTQQKESRHAMKPPSVLNFGFNGQCKPADSIVRCIATVPRREVHRSLEHAI